MILLFMKRRLILCIVLFAGACPSTSFVSQPPASGLAGTGRSCSTCKGWQIARRCPTQAEMSSTNNTPLFGVVGGGTHPGLRSAPSTIVHGIRRAGEYEMRTRKKNEDGAAFRSIGHVGGSEGMKPKRHKHENGWWRDIGRFRDALRAFQEENGLSTDRIPPETVLRGREGGEILS